MENSNNKDIQPVLQQYACSTLRKLVIQKLNEEQEFMEKNRSKLNRYKYEKTLAVQEAYKQVISFIDAVSP